MKKFLLKNFKKIIYSNLTASLAVIKKPAKKIRLDAHGEIYCLHNFPALKKRGGEMQVWRRKRRRRRRRKRKKKNIRRFQNRRRHDSLFFLPRHEEKAEKRGVKFRHVFACVTFFPAKKAFCARPCQTFRICPSQASKSCQRKKK